MSLYYAIVKWYNDYEDEEKETKMFVFAKDYSKAVHKIETNFDNIDSISMRWCAFDTNSILYLPNAFDESTIEELCNENFY